MKRVVFAVAVFLFALRIVAQDSQTAFNFLRLPVSAHVAALGGDNISISSTSRPFPRGGSGWGFDLCC